MLKTTVVIILTFVLSDAISEILYAIADHIRYKTEEKRKEKASITTRLKPMACKSHY